MPEITLEPEIIEIPEPEISHLITEDDIPVDNIFSEKQMRLLTESLYTSWQPAGERSFVALANVGLFYTIHSQAVVPDVMVSTDVQLPEDIWQKKHRSYFVWEYGKPPDLVIEIVSNRVGEELGRKKRLYAGIGVAHYVVYDPQQQLGNKALHCFERRGASYQLMRRNWFPPLEMGLQVWEGTFEGHEAAWLRWHDADGALLLTGAEQAAAERRRAEAERQRAERLAEQLRTLGVEPDVE